MEVLILVGVAAILVAAGVYFCTHFVRPYVLVSRHLDQAIRILEERFELARQDSRQVVDVEAIEREFSSLDTGLGHLWQEFRHTLHAEYVEEVDDLGQPVVGRYRQTAPAELYFSTRTLAEVPLRT